jgi:hypothetical protein
MHASAHARMRADTHLGLASEARRLHGGAGGVVDPVGAEEKQHPPALSMPLTLALPRLLSLPPCLAQSPLTHPPSLSP